ncbi:MAG: hypothetical protein KA123_02735 [Candidatus Eisenbacteria bacterium]|nr:hypothetical protein [Candidatus Eisenbacteria bacterium]
MNASHSHCRSPVAMMLASLAVLLIACSIAGCTRSSAPEEGAWQSVAAPAGSSPRLVRGESSADTLIVPLVTDKRATIGSVIVTSDGEGVRLLLRGAAGWLFDASHAAVVAAPSAFPMTPGGVPRLERFAYQSKHVPPVSEFAYEVDLAADGFEAGDTLFIAVHVDASRAAGMGNPKKESAWARPRDASDQAPMRKVKLPFFVYRLPAAPVPACELTLLSPAGGERLCVGFLCEILWQSSGDCDETVAIELLQDGAVCMTIDPAAPNTGVYEWEGLSACESTPAVCTLRVRALESGAVAQSEPFTIENCGGGE